MSSKKGVQSRMTLEFTKMPLGLEQKLIELRSNPDLDGIDHLVEVLVWRAIYEADREGETLHLDEEVAGLLSFSYRGFFEDRPEAWKTWTPEQRYTWMRQERGQQNLAEKER